MGNREIISTGKIFRGNGLEAWKEDRTPDLTLALRWRTRYEHRFYCKASH